jgi:hypothetical protein
LLLGEQAAAVAGALDDRLELVARQRPQLAIISAFVS